MNAPMLITSALFFNAHFFRWHFCWKAGSLFHCFPTMKNLVHFSHLFIFERTHSGWNVSDSSWCFVVRSCAVPTSAVVWQTAVFSTQRRKHNHDSSNQPDQSGADWPGGPFEPDFMVSPLAWTTSTSRPPFLSIRPISTSPGIWKTHVALLQWRQKVFLNK